MRRGGDARGSNVSRRRRKAWLVETYRADVDGVLYRNPITGDVRVSETTLGAGEPACRCYRCGTLLVAALVTTDRIMPGAEGGTYVRANCRPACAKCNSTAGGHLGRARKVARAS